MTRYKQSILTIFLLLYTFCVGNSSEIPIANVKHLTYLEGMSSHRVFSIVEDYNGAIWISTKMGVDRYNGHEIRNYTLPGEFSYGDMAGRRIQLYQESNGKLLAYDNIGCFYHYSPLYDRFELVLKLSDCIDGDLIINKYLKTSTGKEVFALLQGLYMKDGDGVKSVIGNFEVNDIIEVDGNLFIGTSTGLKILDTHNSLSELTLVEHKNIQTLYHDCENRKLMIGTFNDGLWMLDLDTNQVTMIYSANMPFTNPIRSILNLDVNTLAVGIDGSGIYQLDCRSGLIDLLINADDSNDYYLLGNGVYAMMLDRQGNLWAGSYTGGASLIRLTDSPSKLIIHEKGNPNSLASNNVNAIVENVNGEIWYATDRGVSIFQPNSGKWIHVLEKSIGVTLCPSGDGSMLLGTYGDGVFFLDKEGGITKQLNKQSGDLTSNSIFSIKRDGSDGFWVGALDGELMNLDANGSLISSYPISVVLSTTVIDSSRVAAATVNGFYIVDKQRQTIEQYATAQEQIEHNVSAYIIPMLFNHDQTVWLGTEGGGLTLYHLAERKIIQSYRVSDGLPSNDIYSLQRDSLGRIWVGTGNGIAVIDQSSISSLNYLTGVKKEYNKSASTVLNCGDFIFGGTTGAVRFSPTEINRVDYKGPLRVTGFIIDGISEEHRELLMPKIRSGLEKGVIQLAYNQNYLTVSFESINLRYQEDIAYRYLLEGYDNEWNESTSSGVATYKNIMPGAYILHLLSVQKYDGQIIDEKQIEILISQPWWRSWWVYSLYLFFVGIAIYFIARYKWYQLQKRHDEDKIRFFINTAHDIRTPITLAMAPLEDVVNSESLSSNGTYLLNLARQSIHRLNSITSQLLDFEKIDSGRHLPDFQVIDLCHILQEEIAFFQNVCDKKNITLFLELPDTPICMLGDAYLVEMVFDNLLSNACKYTPLGGFIKVILTATKNKLTVEVVDSGIGIPAAECKHIFSDIYRAKNARESQEMGTGFGLLQVKRIIKMLRGTIEFKSVEGEGSVFSVSFRRVYGEAVVHSRKLSVYNSLDEVMPSVIQKEKMESEDKDISLLIVEDNDDLRNYLVRAFLPDYRVIERATADEAFSYLSTEYPELIISDVMMPGIQGDDFCRMVKSNPDTSGIPIILLTAKTNHESIVTGLQKGADDYIAKPFNTEILKLKVRGLIENRNRLRAYLLKYAMEQVVLASSLPLLEEGDESMGVADLSDGDRKFMERVVDLVICNLADTEFSIDSLCREMAMSRTLFYGRLKSLTGKAPQEFIRILRLERSAELLQQGGSIAEVAEATGFINVKYFSTLFKKQFGMPPSKFLEEMSVDHSK